MRTLDDIVEYYRKHGKDDLLGFSAEVLLPYLPAEKLRKFAKDDADLSEWEPKPLDRETVLAEMKEYMAFAWDKVYAHRGISASRSVEKMAAWVWLLADEDTYAFAKESEHYTNYGAPILMKICQVYGFPIPDDEGVRRMTRGKPCHDGCEEGCGQ
jgi:hypothetical protein